MNLTIYHTALVIHIIGITMMVGATFIDYMVFQQFRKTYPADRTDSLTLLQILGRLQKYMGIGMLAIIVAGIVMMIYLHQVWGQQLWFRIKMALLLPVVINGLGLRRRLGTRLNRLLDASPSAPAPNPSRLIKNMTTVHIIQLILFLIIFILSVFKFN